MSHDAQNNEKPFDLGTISARLVRVEARVDDLASQIGRIARLATLTAARVESGEQAPVNEKSNPPGESRSG